MRRGVPRQEWRRLLLQRHPEIGHAFDRKASGNSLADVGSGYSGWARGSAESRIAYALCELCLLSSPAGLVERSMFHIPMSQQQLGDYCGLSAVHVCRTLRRFKSSGINRFVRAHMDVLSSAISTLSRASRENRIPPTLRRKSVCAAMRAYQGGHDLDRFSRFLR